MTPIMKLKQRPAATAKLVGGRLCLDFVNTIAWRRAQTPAGYAGPGKPEARAEKLNDYDDLLAWGWHMGLLTEVEVKSLGREASRQAGEAESVLARAIALREAIYRICLSVIKKTAPRAADVEVLNRELAAARNHKRLIAGEDHFVWRWMDENKALDRLLWSIADSAADLLTEGDLTRLRECGGATCGWLFEDTSRNRSRHWCDMQDCGNLAKVRRFRTRQRDAQ